MTASTGFVTLVDTSTAFVTPAVGPVSDAALVQLQRDLAEVRRRVDSWSAAVAGQIAHRSRRELGHDGLAQRHGARTPGILVQQLAGTSARESHTMVRVGVLLGAPAALSSVGTAVSDGRLSLDAADAIRDGPGRLDPAVPDDLVASAAESLVADATVLTVEKLAHRAREWAAELDEAHIRDREQALRDARYLRLTPQSDGMTRIAGLLDPESAAVVVATFDGITSPRCGGPRFVDPAAVSDADGITVDPRTTEQVAVDAFVELIRVGSEAAPDIVGAQRPAVRVIVTDGQVVNVGRTQRLFTTRQRIGLAVRDGGCRFPGCERPPSWCECHHINEWHRDHGRTDIQDGVLLCRHHHLLIHNTGWKVTRTRADYLLIPPRTLDPTQTPIPAPPKSQIARQLLTASATT